MFYYDVDSDKYILFFDYAFVLFMYFKKGYFLNVITAQGYRHKVVRLKEMGSRRVMMYLVIQIWSFRQDKSKIT